MTQKIEKYLVDTNIFIQAKNLYYPFNFAPGFWDWLEQINGKNSIISIEPVYKETQLVDDEVSNWCKAHKNLFNSIDNKVYQEISNIQKILVQHKTEQSKINDFMRGIADPYLIAFAKVYDYTIVTQEKLPANNAIVTNKKVQIPPVCIEMGVKWINLFDLLKKEQNHQLILK